MSRRPAGVASGLTESLVRQYGCRQRAPVGVSWTRIGGRGRLSLIPGQVHVPHRRMRPATILRVVPHVRWCLESRGARDRGAVGGARDTSLLLARLPACLVRLAIF
jgi:hypothetical protein